MAISDTRINHQIRAKEVRVIGPQGENFGVLTLTDALKKAQEAGLDLIEISPNALPPIAKISDYGKFQYEANKKKKASQSKLHTVELKTLQVKIGTGDHDLELKAKKASEWLKEGNKIKIDLYLTGRSKFLNFEFLKERLDRVLKLISVPYKIADDIKKGPKGLSIMLEKER